MMTVPEIIALWGSSQKFANDMGLKDGSYARSMKKRGRIPRAHWPRLIEVAAARGFEGVTFEALKAANRPSSVDEVVDRYQPVTPSADRTDRTVAV